MAYRKIVKGRSYPYLYNLNATVGSRKAVYREPGITTYVSSYEPNKRDDVMLVQYLLKRVYQRGQNATPPLNGSSNAPQLVIDGYYGPKTQGAIEQYQLEMRRNGRNIATDGCVDPELGESSEASISHTGYTISWLNKYFYVLYPELFPNIAVDPECPIELKMAVNRS